MSIGKYIVSLMLLAFLLIPTVSMSQVVAPSGKTMEASSQLVLWYDSFNNDSYIQITNTSDTTPVEIHIQIFVSEDNDADPATPAPASTRCREADFNDVLTANDTVLYDLSNGIFLNSSDADITTPIPAPVPDVDGTKGFVVVTPVVGNTDNTAIAFEHLIGTTYVISDVGVETLISAIGRDAVDTATGISLPDGTTLDGINGAFTKIQPAEIDFNLALDAGDNVDVVGIVFADEYNPGGGLLGYRALPGQSTWDPFLFNFQEIPGSCPIATNQCFNNWGLSNQFVNLNNLLDPVTSPLCPLVVLGTDAQGVFSGWNRSFITLDDNENQLAVIVLSSNVLAQEMNGIQIDSDLINATFVSSNSTLGAGWSNSQ